MHQEQVNACRRTVTLGWLRGDDPTIGVGAVRMPSVDQGRSMANELKYGDQVHLQNGYYS